MRARAHARIEKKMSINGLLVYKYFMKNFLSTEERENLKAQHKKERDKRICYRIIDEERYRKGRELLIRIVSMLTRMAKITYMFTGY